MSICIPRQQYCLFAQFWLKVMYIACSGLEFFVVIRINDSNTRIHPQKRCIFYDSKTCTVLFFAPLFANNISDSVLMFFFCLDVSNSLIIGVCVEDCRTKSDDRTPDIQQQSLFQNQHIIAH